MASFLLYPFCMCIRILLPTSFECSTVRSRCFCFFSVDLTRSSSVFPDILPPSMESICLSGPTQPYFPRVFFRTFRCPICLVRPSKCFVFLTPHNRKRHEHASPSGSEELQQSDRCSCWRVYPEHFLFMLVRCVCVCVSSLCAFIPFETLSFAVRFVFFYLFFIDMLF